MGPMGASGPRHFGMRAKRSDAVFFCGSLLDHGHRGRSFPGDFASPSKRPSSPYLLASNQPLSHKTIFNPLPPWAVSLPDR
jgi:hypothetical protein